MKSIAYLIPYFGKLPNSIEMWLLSCKMNPTVNWILLTDDKTEYNYPSNVRVIYCTYDSIKERIKSHYDFPIDINKPWKLCAYKPAYGEIFAQELKGYDFWGHCDMDLIWGDIRKFITDEMLETYDKIGFQGHSTLYRNTPENNSIYKTEIEGITTYKDAFQSEDGFCFDEEAINDIYDHLRISFYKEPNFAHLGPFSNSFYLSHYPKEDDYKNRRQIIVWKNGKILRYYNHNGEMHTEDEFMYFHTFMRPIKYDISQYNENLVYIAYPDKIKIIDENKINYAFIEKHGKCSALLFYVRMAYKYRKKLTVKKVVSALIEKIRRKLKNRI